MGKAFGIVLILVGIWVGLELYTEGSQRAFGGLLVDLGVAEAPAPAADPGTPGEAPLDRIRGRVGADMDLAAERTRRALGEEPE